MLELNSYAAEVAQCIAMGGRNQKSIATAIQSLTQCALSHDSFFISCVTAVLNSIERSSGSWENPPLYTSARPACTVRLIYWPANYVNNAHVHNTWSVNGVWHNEIVVQTFASTEDALSEPARVLRTIHAKRGDVGYLLAPCIHRLSNPGKSASATLHVLGADDCGRPAAQSTIWLGGSRRGEILLDVKDRALKIICEVLASIEGDVSLELLERAYGIGGAVGKLAAVRALARRDIRRAHIMSRRLEAQLSGRDREVLAAINVELASALAY